MISKLIDVLLNFIFTNKIDQKIVKRYAHIRWSHCKRMFNSVGSNSFCESCEVKNPEYITIGSDFYGGKEITLEIWPGGGYRNPAHHW